MTGSQSGPTHAPDAVPGLPRSIRSAAEPLVAAGLAAHGSVVGLTAFSAPPPLLTALVATLAFAGISLAYRRRVGAVVGPAPRRLAGIVLANAVVLVIVGTGAWLTGRVLGTGAGFYCEPFVPWRIEIALFGSFGVAYFAAAVRQRRLARAAYPLAVLALLWIAPFYGFFSAPLFLGLSLNTMCAGRPIVTVVLAGVGMCVGEQLGLTAANWICGAVHPRGDA
ncbi:MAG TPA: hypothetical protein VMS64_00655 [Candidatus Methylomirabilis sp.]|nr:hypothetical protein [Candidatus Methylomirabilis sp.]